MSHVWQSLSQTYPLAFSLPVKGKCEIETTGVPCLRSDGASGPGRKLESRSILEASKMVSSKEITFDLIEEYYALRDEQYIVEITGDISKALRMMEESDEDFYPGVLKNVFHVNGIITRRLQKAGITYTVLRPTFVGSTQRSHDKSRNRLPMIFESNSEHGEKV